MDAAAAAAGFAALRGRRRVSLRTRPQQASYARKARRKLLKKQPERLAKLSKAGWWWCHPPHPPHPPTPPIHPHPSTTMAQAWNKLHGLRAGECVSLHGEVAPGMLRKWQIEGMLRLGYRGVGKHAAAADGDAVGESTHTLNALRATAWLCDRSQSMALHSQLDAALSSPLALCIVWHHDATPWQVRFGSFQAQLHRHAMYPVKGADGRWTTVPYDKYRELGGPALPSSGIAQIFSQVVEIYWESDLSSLHCELIPLPCVLASSSASCMYRACNESSLDMGLPRLAEIASKVVVMIYTEVPDNISSNFRKKHAWLRALPHNVLYAAAAGCAVHRVHRCIAAATDEDCGDKLTLQAQSLRMR